VRVCGAFLLRAVYWCVGVGADLSAGFIASAYPVWPVFFGSILIGRQSFDSCAGAGVCVVCAFIKTVLAGLS